MLTTLEFSRPVVGGVVVGRMATRRYWGIGARSGLFIVYPVIVGAAPGLWWAVFTAGGVAAGTLLGTPRR